MSYEAFGSNCSGSGPLPAGPRREVDDSPEDRAIGVHYARFDKTSFSHPTQNLLAAVIPHALARMKPARERVVALCSFRLEVEQVQRSAGLQNAAHLAQRRKLRRVWQMVKHEAREDTIEAGVRVRQGIRKTLIEAD